MLLHSQFDCTRQYLNALQKSKLITFIMVTTSILHIFWLWIFVIVLDYELIGVGIACVISKGLNFVAITAVCSCLKSIKDSFFFFTRESFQNIKEQLAIGVPNAMMLCFEWAGLEVLALFASAINVDALAA